MNCTVCHQECERLVLNGICEDCMDAAIYMTKHYDIAELDGCWERLKRLQDHMTKEIRYTLPSTAYVAILVLLEGKVKYEM